MSELVMKQPGVQIRWNLILVLLLGGALILVLGTFYPKEATALIGAMSVLLGYAGGAVKELVAPSAKPPDPEIDEGSVTPKGVVRIIRTVTGQTPETPAATAAVERKGAVQIRLNLLFVLIIGGMLVLLLSRIFRENSVAIIALANGLLGYAGSSVKELVAPSPAPPDPEIDEGKLTPRGFERIGVELKQAA